MSCDGVDELRWRFPREGFEHCNDGCHEVASMNCDGGSHEVASMHCDDGCHEVASMNCDGSDDAAVVSFHVISGAAAIIPMTRYLPQDDYPAAVLQALRNCRSVPLS